MCVHASIRGWHCLGEFITHVEESPFGVNWDGMGVSCENFSRFLEYCAHLERPLLYLLPQMRRCTDFQDVKAP